jgi:hypothetical protein
LQQDRGHPAALYLHGAAVLAGIVAAVASHVVATASASVAAPLSPSGLLSPLLAAAPVVDLSPDDDETARELKDRAANADAGAASNGRLNTVRFFFAHIPEAEFAPAGRFAFSLGPRAPPRGRNVNLRRLAWQA